MIPNWRVGQAPPADNPPVFLDETRTAALAALVDPAKSASPPELDKPFPSWVEQEIADLEFSRRDL